MSDAGAPSLRMVNSTRRRVIPQHSEGRKGKSDDMKAVGGTIFPMHGLSKQSPKKIVQADNRLEKGRKG